MNDAHKAKIALADFARNHCIDGKFRYKKIDWAQFKKNYGVRISVTERDNEEQMDRAEHDDYWLGKNKTSEFKQISL